jgi:hypothetical protein
MIKDDFFSLSKIYSNSFLFKKYTFFDKKYIYQSKIRQNHFSNYGMSIRRITPEITWTYKDNTIIQKIKLIKAKKPVQTASVIKLLEFSKKLDQLRLDINSHGDINRKNILENNDQLFLIDIEPVVNFKEGDNFLLMSTKPYIHSSDYEKGKLTILSDLLGFGCFSLWYMRKYSKPYLAINDKVFQNLISLSKDKEILHFSNLLNLLIL